MARLSEAQKKENKKLSARKSTVIRSILKANPTASKDVIDKYIKDNIPRYLWNTRTIPSYIAQQLHLPTTNIKESGKGDVLTKKIGDRRKALINLGATRQQKQQITRLIQNKSLHSLFSPELLLNINRIITRDTYAQEENILFRNLVVNTFSSRAKLLPRQVRGSRKEDLQVAEYDGFNYKSVHDYLEDMRPQYSNLIRRKFASDQHAMKVRIRVICYMYKQELVNDHWEIGEMVEVTLGREYASECFIDNINDVLDEQYAIMLSEYDQITDITPRMGSGFIMSTVKESFVYMSQHNLRGGSYMKTPEVLELWLCNYKHNDKKNQECLLHSLVIASEYPKFKGSRNPKRESNYTAKINELSTLLAKENFKFPVHPHQGSKIRRLEKLFNANIVIYGYEYKKKPYIIRDTPQEAKTRTTLNVVLISNNTGNYHYIAITRLIQFRSLGKNPRGEQICPRCFYKTKHKNLFEKHMAGDCAQLNKTQVQFPLVNNRHIYFKNIKYSHPAPFAILSDLEALTLGVHKANSIAYKVVCLVDDKLTEETVIISGMDCIQRFLQEIVKVVERLCKFYETNNIPIIMTNDDNTTHKSADCCYLCNKEFSIDNRKVRDHCHITGKYRGPACNNCNINYNSKGFKIPVIFHNGRGYDFHFLLSDYVPSDALTKHPNYLKVKDNKLTKEQLKIKELQKAEQFKVIAESSEKFKTIQYKRISFIDSLQFFPFSLSEMTESLGKSKHNWSMLQKAFPGIPLTLLTHKGIYPYDWVDNEAKFEYTTLPTYECFKSSLSGQNISRADYLKFKIAWKVFKCKKFKDFHDNYLKLDVELLHEIWKYYTQEMLKVHKVDPNHFISGPSVCQQAMLKTLEDEKTMKTTKDKKIETFYGDSYIHKITGKCVREISEEEKNDYHMIKGNDHIFYRYEKGLRGGYSSVGGKRFVKANNPMMKNYDPSLPTVWILYYDANSLYWFAMVQSLPIGGHEDIYTINNIPLHHLSHDKLLNFLENVDENGPLGYTIEVDITLPRRLHKVFSDFPLFVESTDDSPIHGTERTKRSKVKKLVGSLNDKKKYFTDYRMLKLGMQLGYRVTKVHSVTQFRQEKFMKDYIVRNIKRRQNAKAIKDEVQNKLAKLDGHNVYGKTMESVRNRKDYRLVISKKSDYSKLLSHPRFTGNFTIISDELTGVELSKRTTTLNKPISIGFTVTELSKCHMYNVYYNVLKKKYGDKIRMCYTDTDSFFLEVNTGNWYEDVKTSAELTKWFNDSGLPGMFEDETDGNIITEAVFLASKMYSFKFENEEENRKKYINALKQQEQDVERLEIQYETNPELVIDELFSGKYDVKAPKVTRRAKGYQKDQVLYNVQHEIFKRALFYDNPTSEDYHPQYNPKLDEYKIGVARFQSKAHKITTTNPEINKKKGLSRNDDKRQYFGNDVVNAYAWGYNPE